MTDRLRKLGLTPAKGALIAVLALGLGAVWGPQLARLMPKRQTVASQAPPQAAVARQSPVTPVDTPKTGGKELKDRKKTQRLLPAIGLAEAITFDPFAIPAWSPAASLVASSNQGSPQETAQARFDAIQQTGVAMVLVADGEQVVQIGEKMLRVGDRIDGFEVVEITPQGVVFRPVDPGEGDRGA